MSIDTSITAKPILDPATPLVEPAPRPRTKPWYIRALQAVASLRITVVLFVVSIFLVFFGTLAQVDQGIWTVVNTYFRTALVWIPLQIFFPRDWEIAGSFPYPGGWLLGGLLLANLLAAHAIRFKASWKRAGILLIHAGIIVMMSSELITGLFAIEGRMNIDEGGASNFVSDYHRVELAVMEALDKETDNVVVVPDGFLHQGGVVRHDLLPFDVEIVRYMANSKVLETIPPSFANPADRGLGVRLAAVSRPRVAGTSDGAVDTPAAYVALKDKGSGKSLGIYMLSSELLKPQPVTLGDKTYDVALRFKRTYKPYTIHLLEARQDNYLGTGIAKSFSSRVLVVDPERKEKRDVTISMNAPLRYRGETFYQQNMGPEMGPGGPVRTTGLQVVRNPGWLMPYISCAMVSIGMMVHFGLHLKKFLEAKLATRSAS